MQSWLQPAAKVAHLAFALCLSSASWPAVRRDHLRREELLKVSILTLLDPPDSNLEGVGTKMVKGAAISQPGVVVPLVSSMPL